MTIPQKTRLLTLAHIIGHIECHPPGWSAWSQAFHQYLWQIHPRNPTFSGPTRWVSMRNTQQLQGSFSWGIQAESAAFCCQSPVGFLSIHLKKYVAQPLDYAKPKAYILTFTNTCWRAMWKNETSERWYIPRQPLSICKQTIPMTQTCSWKPGWVNTKEPSPSIGFVTAQWFSACVSKQGVEEVKQGKLERTEHFKSEWWWDCHGFCSYYIAQFYTPTSFPLQNQKGWPL